jgi:RNA polymerase sigma-70 factor (ECF subfamily)
MLLHASRFDARLDPDGRMLLLSEQNRALWNRELIARGMYYLNHSSEGNRITCYHLEAAIAAQHSLASKFDETDWPAILELYDHMIRLYPSPIHELNRAIVVAQIFGPDAGISAIREHRTIRHAQRLPPAARDHRRVSSPGGSPQ